jgi:hypothetical protein
MKMYKQISRYIDKFTKRTTTYVLTDKQTDRQKVIGKMRQKRIMKFTIGDNATEIPIYYCNKQILSQRAIDGNIHIQYSNH